MSDTLDHDDVSPSVSDGLCRVLTMVALAVASAITLVLAGCANPSGIASHAQPLAPARVGLAEAGATPAVDAQWWRMFGDAELDGLVARALADSPSLQVAAARVARAGAGADAARADGLPSVRLDADLERQHYTANGAVPPPLAGSTANNGSLQASGSWELDFFGRNRAALEAALGGQRALAADEQAARVMLATDVVRAYVGLARAGAQRRLAERTLAQRQELFGLIRSRVQAGLDTNVELRQGEGSLPDARLAIAQLDEQIVLARHRLAALTVQSPDALAALTPTLLQADSTPAPAPFALPERIGADLLGRRADISAARARVEAAVQDVAAARAQFYPDVNLRAFVGLSALGLDRVFEGGSRQFGVGPAISLPIFDAGRLRANLRGRAADVDAAVESYNTSVLDAVHEVADQIASLRSIDDQQREQRSAQGSAEAAYELAVQRYRAGLSTYLIVLNAETTLLAQRRQAADLAARALDSRALLMRGLGGGWQGASQTALAALPGQR